MHPYSKFLLGAVCMELALIMHFNGHPITSIAFSVPAIYFLGTTLRSLI